MTDDPVAGDVTLLLDQFSQGQPQALEALLPAVYGELRRLAANRLRKERVNHTLQPTALVHEAYFRLVNQQDVRWQNRAHFFGIAAQAMRRILIDHARGQARHKRGGAQAQVTLDEGMLSAEARSVDLLALDEVLLRLERLDARQARVVELRFFGGLSVEETAEVMSLSPATIKREWSMARAWLFTELAPLERGD